MGAVTVSQLADVSLPYISSSQTDAIFSFVGSLACLALYILFQFGFVADIEQIQYQFAVSSNGKIVSWSNVQFACDRLLTAVFFLLKQTFSITIRPGTFVTIKAEVRKKVEVVS